MKIRVAASVQVSASRDRAGSFESDMCGRKIAGMAPIARQMRRPNGAESRNLNIRVPSEVLDAAKAKAAEREETLSSAVVAFLREYASEAVVAPE